MYTQATPGVRANRPRSRLSRAVALLALVLSLGACSGFSLFGRGRKLPDEPADRLYNEGLYYLNYRNDPHEAVKKFEEVDRQHPYSEWARKSLIMSAYAYYQAGSYDECVAAAKRYIALHPAARTRPMRSS